MRRSFLFLILLAGLTAWMAACSDGDDGGDAGTDAVEDAGQDAGHDAGEDAGQDAGEDAGQDAGEDAGQDAGEDAGQDAGGDEGPGEALLLFNEVLTDGACGEDANGDGSIDAVEDEFVELVNVGDASADLSGWTLVDRDWGVYLPRHTFAEGTTLEPGAALVVFGGGEPPVDTARAQFVISNAADPGTFYGLDLDADGDVFRLLDADGEEVAVYAYGDGGGEDAISDESATRFPDLSGDFTPHSQASGDPEIIFSPGTRVDGSPF